MNCGACGRENDRRRRFCGGCAYALAPVCARCEFQNDVGDRFCGGCGTTLGAAVEASRPRGHAIPLITSEELAELLAELLALPDPEPERLPTGPIAQDDLDRLFGGAT